MAASPKDKRMSSHTGSRIRERRLSLEMRQGQLAKAAGISASYLNLIEHNKRRIGGKILIDLAQALGTQPAALTDGPEATLYDALQATAAVLQQSDVPPEIDRIETLVSRFPGWAAALAAQRRQIAGLEAQADALRDRLNHDKVLADSLHEVLSTASAIRATSGILVEDDSIDPQWRVRFHRNLHEEAVRLSDRATALTHHFEREQNQAYSRPNATPVEVIEQVFDQVGHHFAELETGGAKAIAPLLEATPELHDPNIQPIAEAAFQAYVEDAAALPLAPFLAAAREADFMPEPLYAMAAGDVARVFRRLASLPPDSGAPPFGLAVCDAAGALLHRRRHPGFSVPRHGDGCPLWPLYRALSRPLAPEAARIELPDGAIFETWSVSQPAAIAPGGISVLRATMLIRADLPDGTEALRVGPGCTLCTRANCTARRAPGLTL